MKKKIRGETTFLHTKWSPAVKYLPLCLCALETLLGACGVSQHDITHILPLSPSLLGYDKPQCAIPVDGTFNCS